MAAFWLFLMLASCVHLLESTNYAQVADQSPVTLMRSVAVTSDPPGATIWIKEGRSLNCTNTLTPGNVELKFHGPNDVRKILLRRFGYPRKDLDIKITDENVGAALGEPASDFFATGDDAPLELRRFNAGVKQEFVRVISADPEASRCESFELRSAAVAKERETPDLILQVNINLDRSFGGLPLRVASHARARDERRQKMAEAALDGGVADLLMRIGQIAAKFPEIKMIELLCGYSGTEASLGSESVLSTHIETRSVVKGEYVYDTVHQQYEYKVHSTDAQVPVLEREERTTVQDDEVERVITFAVPVAALPTTPDKMATRNAVLKAGKIVLQN